MRVLKLGLAALVGGAVVSSATLTAQEPPPQAVTPPPVLPDVQPQPVAPEPVPGPMITESTNGSTTVIENAGNGVGNTIVTENGGPGGGTTVIRNARNGFGNRVIIQNGGRCVELGSCPPPDVGGVGAGFDWRDFVPMDRPTLNWTARRYDRNLGCWMYWSPRDFGWYWYDATRTAYRPWYVHPATGW